MLLRDRLQDSLKTAMRAKDPRAISTIRMALAAIKESDIEARTKGVVTGVNDTDILSILQKLVKQRRDSIELYIQGGRPELAQQESEEITVLEGFLPQQMSAESARSAIASLIQELSASGPKDMGKVMTELRSRYAGQMDFSQASGYLKELLNSKN